MVNRNRQDVMAERHGEIDQTRMWPEARLDSRLDHYPLPAVVARRRFATYGRGQGVHPSIFHRSPRAKTTDGQEPSQGIRLSLRATLESVLNRLIEIVRDR